MGEGPLSLMSWAGGRRLFKAHTGSRFRREGGLSGFLGFRKAQDLKHEPPGPQFLHTTSL